MKHTHLVILLFLLYAKAHSIDENKARLCIIDKISVSGIFTGKDSYKKLYHLSKGTPFNQAEHDDGIHAIEKHLHKQGYLAGHVTTRYSYNTTQSQVGIKLHITPGTVYKIGTVTCKFSHENSQEQEETDALLKKLQERLANRLKNNVCTQELLDSQARMVSAYLSKKGYLFAGIEMEQIRHDDICKVDITFTCTLKHKKQFIFSGNHAFSSEQLYQHCSEFGKSLIIIPPEILAQELQDFYHTNGFLDATVTGALHDQTLLVFTICENKKSFIEKVTVLENAHTHYFKYLEKSAYDIKKIKKALHECLQDLISKGYHTAQITENSTYKLASENYELRIAVEPGEQLIITKITADNFHDYTKKAHQQSWCKNYLILPATVDINIIARLKKFIHKQLHESGYLYTHVTPQFITEDDGTTTLKWEFTGKQDKVYFGDTIIRGSCKVPNKLIERTMAYKKGDVWDRKKLDETALTLRNFGVFDQVTVFPENITREEDAKTIVIQMQDSDPFELRTRVGFQGVGTNLSWRGGGTYKFGGTFLWKNPRHCADIFSMQIDVTSFYRYALMMYQLAFLGPWPIRQQFKVYSNRYNQPVVLGSREILYRFAQDGFFWALSQDHSGLQWGVTTGVDWMKIYDISNNLATAIDFTTKFIDKTIPYFFCEPSVYVSDIDNRLDPLKGWYLMLSSKALVPLTVKNGANIKFLLEQGNYIPLHKESHTLLAIRLRLGTILYQQFSAIMPPERFYLGGAYSLRGYEPDLAPPLNFYKNCNNELIVVPTGGKTMMNANFELRFPLYSSLGGTFFNDIGVLTQHAATDIRMGDIIGATGFGLRWNTLVGPLRFDIGWKWKQFPGNTNFYNQASYAWFLTLGNAF